MLNSLPPKGTDQYALKLNSMFNLAIATQQERYTAHFPVEQFAPGFTINQRRNQQPSCRSATSPILDKTHLQPHSERNYKTSIVSNSSQALSPQFHMEEGKGILIGDEMRYSSASEVGKASSETINPVNNLENTMMSHINYNNNLIGGSVPFDQHLNFMNNPRRRGCIDGGEGKQRGKKQGPSSGNKTPFSIESLLAHTNNWRRNQADFNSDGACSGRGTTGKDSRFLPYPLPNQAQEQIRTSSRQGSPDDRRNIKPSGGMHLTETEKRPENLDGTNGSKSGGNGRRVGKSKRVRTIFTPEQLERLEAEFERQQYMVGPERLYLASSLYLTEAQVKVWFQNRRIKWRKQHLEMEQQRLAIYRTLAEQDMSSSVEDDDQEDSIDCDYSVDEGDFEKGTTAATLGGIGDEEERAAPNQLGVTSSQPLHPPPNHPHLTRNISAPSLISSTQFKSTHINKIPDTRFPHQQIQQQQRQSPSIIDDYDACSLTNSSASSPSSSRGAGSIQVGNHGVIQAGKK